MIHDLSLALTEYEDDPSLRCAVIFAHGEHFTAGLDLVELQPKLTAGVFDFPMSQINPWGTNSRPRTKPVVVAVQGFCFTAGIELMLNADVVIADANTRRIHNHSCAESRMTLRSYLDRERFLVHTLYWSVRYGIWCKILTCI